MGRGSAKGSPPKKKPGKKAAAKSRAAPKRAARTTRSFAKPDAKLADELTQAQARQTATSEILRIISQSPSNVQPVFEAIVLAAVRLLGCQIAHFLRCDGATFSPVAVAGPEGLVKTNLGGSVPVDPDANFPSRVMVTRKILHVRDLSKVKLPSFERRAPTLRGINSSLLLPLLRGKECIGVLAIGSKRAHHFDKPDIALAESFRDQALIAVENARMFNETRESLERQTATAAVLEVINSSQGNLNPVFDAILREAHALCGIASGSLELYDGERFVGVAAHGHSQPFADVLRAGYIATESPATVPLLAGYRVSHIHDAREVDFPVFRAAALIEGIRTVLFVPLRKGGRLLGMIAAARHEVKPFSEKEIGLLENFAVQAAIAIENARLFNETKEALEQQTATSEVLEVISSSPGELEPVFAKMLENAVHVCGASFGTMNLWDGEKFEIVADHNVPPDFAASRQSTALRPHPGTILATVVKTLRAAQVRDMKESPSYLAGVPMAVNIADIGGARTLMSVPMLKEGELVGVITIFRKEVRPFTDKQVALVENFTKQAVIAIENTRLLRELRERTGDLSESLQQQTATGEVLKVIASSPTDVKPALQAIVESACAFCNSYDAGVLLKVGDTLQFSAHHGPIRTGQDPRPINREWVVGRSVIDKVPVQVSDFQSPEAAEFPEGQRQSREQGHRCTLSVPLLREGEAIGAIAMRRIEPIAFNEKQVALLQTFADQAVIAIENVRLFNETREALERQTATADILKVIASSPSDVQPVFEAIAERSNRLIESLSTAVYSIVGDTQYLMAFTRSSPEADAALQASFPRPLSAVTWGDQLRNGQIVQVPDFAATVEWAEQPAMQKMARLRGFRALLLIPLRREGATIGVISVTRKAPGAFASQHVQLLQTFADQAVIAIENVRLFNETKEALERQTATADVLKVIASSPTNLKPVFDAIAERSNRLMAGHSTAVYHFIDEMAFLTAFTPVNPEADAALRSMFPRPISSLTQFNSSKAGEVVQISDIETADTSEDAKLVARVRGFRSCLFVPLLSDGAPIGVISVTRKASGSFAQHDVSLLRMFADQAVIAIGNVRLFEEVQQRSRELSESLQQQTATADVLRIISSSPGDLAPVFDKMLENATRVCGAEFGSMLLIEKGTMRSAAVYNVPAAFAAARDNRTFFRPHPKSPLAKAIRTKQVAHVADLRTTEGYLERGQASVELVELGGARTAAIVPMLRDDEVIGAITVYRKEVQLFSDKQIELLSNFAKQAVIAIENARLLKELRQKTDDLSKSLDELRTAQDRLVQTEKLASLGQLTAGIAHEIKNPLNFVSNFASLSAELTDELKDVLEQAEISEKMRTEVDELTALLKDNLDKVVQHGKRADSIVKNMLLHSREGSGERRSAEINRLVEESLNLAYHGARAEKAGFSITLKHDLDPDAGALDLYPQEITRALLNLISNGFYAATKRKAEVPDGDFEPVLSAATRNHGQSVEIRIRDNGTGIAAEVREKMFNPFFTTKPTGEGTGLGLSMTHDIIVKQHGGRIDVETEPGVFTEFIITLPRKGSAPP